jgi:hypothetical protein
VPQPIRGFDVNLINHRAVRQRQPVYLPVDPPSRVSAAPKIAPALTSATRRNAYADAAAEKLW